MEDNELKTTILNILNPSLIQSDMNTFISNGHLICSLKVKEYLFSIDYEIIDHFYTVKMEYRQGVLFLSRSKEFKDEIYKIIKTNKLNKHNISDHMISLANLIKKMMTNGTSFEALESVFVQNKKFDGIFL